MLFVLFFWEVIIYPLKTSADPLAAAVLPKLLRIVSLVSETMPTDPIFPQHYEKQIIYQTWLAVFFTNV